MRPVRLGLAVVLGLIALIATAAAPSLAQAASATPAVEITKDQRTKGMAAAPAMLTAIGSSCQLADARFIGEATDPKTKVKSSLYEVACTGDEGLLLENTGVAGQTPMAFTCMEAATPGPDGKKGANQCALPANLDPKAGLVPYIAKAKINCTPDKIRAIGHTDSGAYFELVCHEGGGGYILQISSPPSLSKPVTADPCLMYDPSSKVTCTLTDRATQLAVIDNLASQSGKPCVVKDRGVIGKTESGEIYFEVACQDGKGYVLEEKPGGGLAQAIDCTNADAIAGGCKLTDTRQAKTEQAGLYTTLSKKAGFDCTVSGYAPLPVNAGGKEVVELSCSNRPDGAIGVFGATAADASSVYDCAHAELKGFRCALTKASTTYPALTKDLNAVGKNSCTVSEARTVGVSAEQKGYIEVGCADGLQGYMIVYSMSPITPQSALICAEASSISNGCTLPGNTKK
jgi:hypothetical protein